MIHYRTVVFDCDSTLSTVEGIEELAGEHRRDIETLTDTAMRGEVPLDEVYGRRLELIRPTREAVRALGPRYIEGMVEDAGHTVRALQAGGIEVRVVSGGLRPAVLALTRHIGVPDEAVAAVDISFDETGSYSGFDRDSACARAGGKAELIRAWRQADPPLPGPVMLVGDGATDLEAREDVDLFVGYAGVVARPEVLSEAPVVVRSASLAPILPLALGDGRPADPAAADLYDRGKKLIRDGYVEWK